MRQETEETLRGGYTTGACAAAGAKAAAMLLAGPEGMREVDIPFPDGSRVAFQIRFAEKTGPTSARAAVRKFAGDDPDVTDGTIIISEVERTGGEEVLFRAGEGVGTVTKPGLQIPPGEPAVNPVPRKMIRRAVGEIMEGGFTVTLSIPGGSEIAKRTFNPRLGIIGGLSILGTTGRVVPYSCPALRQSLRCSIDVAVASGVEAPVFVPGNIGRKAAERHFRLSPLQIVEVANEWGFMLDEAAKEEKFTSLLALGHPGKLAKLIRGHWNTHSKNSPPATNEILDAASRLLGRRHFDSVTVEGILKQLAPEERAKVSVEVAERTAQAVSRRLGGRLDASVALIDMEGNILGSWGDLSRWTWKRG